MQNITFKPKQNFKIFSTYLKLKLSFNNSCKKNLTRKKFLLKQLLIDLHYQNMPLSKKFKLFIRKNKGLLLRLLCLSLLAIGCFYGLYSAMIWYCRPPFVYIYLNTIFGSYDLSKKACTRKRKLSYSLKHNKLKNKEEHFYDNFFL